MSQGRPTGRPAAAPVAAGPAASTATPHAWPWLLAARPQTLAVGVAPVVLATALAWAQGAVCWPVFTCALGGSVCIQVGTNLFNDWADARRGADADDRLGPLRVTQRGLLPAARVLFASVVAFGLASLFGGVLLAYGGALVLAVGCASVLAGVLYTGGPAPLAYHGLGEPFAFVFFGPVPVVTTVVLHGHPAGVDAWGLGAALGAFSAAVLVVNNLRDRFSDARAQKNTLAVRLGAVPTRRLYAGLLCGAYATAAALGAWALAHGRTPWAWASLATLPLAWRAVRGVGRDDGAALNPWLGATARLEAAFAACAAVGAFLARVAGTP